MEAEHRQGHARRPPVPVAPLDVDGVGVVTVGTALFGLASLLGWIGLDWLQAQGRGWWLAVAVCGFVLGLVGLAYCRRRRVVSIGGRPGDH